MLDPGTLTLGFARRATAYKRAALLFSDPERLVEITERRGPLQLVFAGKAHPRDRQGQALIRRIHRVAAELGDRIALVYLADYDMTLGRLLCAGSDVWLNTPLPPLEASGTSGMKAALNGVPSLSVPDGWWVEGLVEGVTGWGVGPDKPPRGRASARRRDPGRAEALYDKLEQAVLPLFYDDPRGFEEMRRSCIALNGAWFHTQRMALQYLREAYEAG